MENGSTKERVNKKKKAITELATIGLRAFAQGALTGLGMKFGTDMYERISGSKKYRASVADIRKQG